MQVIGQQTPFTLDLAQVWVSSHTIHIRPTSMLRTHATHKSYNVMYMCYGDFTSCTWTKSQLLTTQNAWDYGTSSSVLNSLHH